jgi:hypothetical protein
MTPFNNQGNTSIVVALTLSAGLLAVIQQSSEQLNSKVQESKARARHDDRKTQNVSAMVQAQALLSFGAVTPAADDLNTMPSLFPDPYLGNKAISAIKEEAPAVDNWAFSTNGLTIKSASRGDLTSGEFDKMVYGTGTASLSDITNIKFLGPLKDPIYPNWIRGYRVLALTASNGQETSNEAAVDVDRLPIPKCQIINLSGKDLFEPEEEIELGLDVSGVATSAYVPTTATAAVSGQYTSYTPIGISQKATSIRTIDKRVHRWTLTAPRPLTAVDGNAQVPFVITAFLKPVDDTDVNATKCSLTVQIAPPAVCKIFTSKATVAPGSCTDLTVSFAGASTGSTFSMAAEDPADSDLSSFLTKQSSTSYKFCAPTVAQRTGAVPAITELGISSASAAGIDAAVKSLNSAQLSSYYTYLDSARKDLTAMFPDSVPLQELSFTQLDAIAGLSRFQRKNIATIDITAIPGLEDLRQDSAAALAGLDATSIVAMPTYDITGTRRLARLPSSTQAKLNSLPALDAEKYVARLIQLQSGSLDYTMVGEVRKSGALMASCLVHVTAGTNSCPFLGSSYPNVSSTVTFKINGNSGYSYTFSPGSPNWEVASVANSPYDTSICPPDARCYAISQFGSRHMFVTLQPANSASCKATSTNRTNLGCFEYHTPIRMADGTDREINEIKIGDMVWNPLTKKGYKVERTTNGPEREKLVVIKSGDLALRVTTKHPVPTRRGIKQAIDITTDDEIQDKDGNWKKISQIRRESARLPVINLFLATQSNDPADHAVLADGVVAGDLFLQEQIEAERVKAEELAFSNQR